MLQDKNIDLAVLGEGELVLANLIRKILENNNEIPGYDKLKEIKGLAFIDKEYDQIPSRFCLTIRDK